MKLSLLACALLLAGAAAAQAQNARGAADVPVQNGDSFANGKDEAKIHVASGFLCPAAIGIFERDAVGEADPETGTDFCAYSALDGVYGTILITPLTGAYNPKASMADAFAEQEGIGGKLLGDKTVTIGTPPLAVFTRRYQLAQLEDLTYTILFAGAAMGAFSVDATIEYADPRDTPQEKDFLNAVYQAVAKKAGAQPH